MNAAIEARRARNRGLPDPAVAYAVGLLLWFPAAPLPGPLTDNRGQPPRWWSADEADRLRAEAGP